MTIWHPSSFMVRDIFKWFHQNDFEKSYEKGSLKPINFFLHENKFLRPMNTDHPRFQTKNSSPVSNKKIILKNVDLRVVKRWKNSFNGFSSSVVDNKKEIELAKVFVKMVELHFEPIQTITQILNPLNATIIYFLSPNLVNVQATLNNSKRISLHFWRMEEFRRRIQLVKCLDLI